MLNCKAFEFSLNNISVVSCRICCFAMKQEAVVTQTLINSHYAPTQELSLLCLTGILVLLHPTEQVCLHLYDSSKYKLTCLQSSAKF